MNRHLVAAAALLGVGLASGAAAQAQQPAYPQPYQRPPVGARYREHDVRWVAAHVGTSVLTLEKRREFGGHRGAALNFLQDARRELWAAVAFATQNRYEIVNLGDERPRGAPLVRDPRAYGDRALYDAQVHVPIWIDMLQHDTRDFGGHRVAAIGALQRAESELNAAVQTGQ